MSSSPATKPPFLLAVLLSLVAGFVLAGASAAQAASPVTVSLVFNDGRATQYRNAAPLLESKGLDGTFYVASNWVKTNDANYMRFYQLDELYRQGNEIGGMGKDHKSLTATYDPDPAADLAYKKDQVCGDFAALDGWGYHPVSFAYPFANEDATAQGIVHDCGFTTGRVAGGLSATGPAYAENVPPANPLRVRVGNTPAGPITLASLQNLVVAAGDHGGGWLPLAFNDVCSTADAGYSTCMGSGNKPIDATVLSDFLDWLNSQAGNGVQVRTVRQAMGSEQPPLPPRPFVVSLTFDDGLRSQYGLKGVFARHDVHGTFYINSGPADRGEEGTMSWAQIRDLRDAGHDIGGHTTEHINMLDTSTSLEFKTRQTCDDRQRLIEEGFNPVSFAYPFGAMDATTQPIVRGCGYQSARKAGTVTSDGPIFSETIPVTENPYAIRILGTNDNGPVTLDALEHAVDQAISHGGSWLPTLFHQICYAGTPDFASCMAGYRPVSDATIDDFLSWIQSQASTRNISVKTVADVMGGGSTAPRVAVTGPAEAASVTTGTPELTGTASGAGPVSVSVYSGSYSTGTALTTLTAQVANGQWSVRPGSALPDGSYTVQASQVGGNATGTSIPRRFVVDSTSGPTDTTAPVVAITTPAQGATLRSTTPGLAGSGGTAEGDAPQVTLRLYAGSAPTGSPLQTFDAPIGADGTWSATASALADGTYTATASQSDTTGNVGSSVPVTFTIDTAPVDTTAPVVTVGSPANGTTVTTGTPQVSGTAGTVAGDDTQVTVTVSPSAGTTDAVRTLSATVRTDGTWAVSPGTALADGTWTVSATQHDRAGNVGTSNASTFVVDTRPADTTAPTVTLTTPAAGARITTADFTAGGAAGAAPGDAATVTLAVYAGTSATGTPARSVTAAVSGASWTTPVTGLAPGTWTLRASQADAAGNVGLSAARTITKVAAPTIASVSPASLGQGASQAVVTVNGSGFTSSSAVTFSGSGLTSTVASRTATAITLRVTVAAGAATSARDLTVTNGNGGHATCTGCLTVVAGPKITSVSPATVLRARSTTVTLAGAGFRAGQMAVTVSGSGVTVGTVSVQSPTSMTVVLTVSSTATRSSRTMTVRDRQTLGAATGTVTVG